MMSEAYGLSLLVVIGVLSFLVVRAAVTRPAILLVVGFVGIFAIGYIVGHFAQSSEAVWHDNGGVRAEPVRAGSGGAERVAPRAPNADRGLVVKLGTKISIDVFDAAAKGALTNHDRVDVPLGTVVHIAGWAADESASAACRFLYLAVGVRRFDVPYGLARPDVAAYFHDAAYGPTGFVGELPTDILGKGTYAVNVECLGGDGKTLYVSSHPRTLVVR